MVTGWPSGRFDVPKYSSRRTSGLAINWRHLPHPPPKSGHREVSTEAVRKGYSILRLDGEGGLIVEFRPRRFRSGVQTT